MSSDDSSSSAFSLASSSSPSSSSVNFAESSGSPLITTTATPEITESPTFSQQPSETSAATASTTYRLSAGAIVGIVLGPLALIALGLFGFLLWRRRRRRVLRSQQAAIRRMTLVEPPTTKKAFAVQGMSNYGDSKLSRTTTRTDSEFSHAPVYNPTQQSAQSPYRQHYSRQSSISSKHAARSYGDGYTVKKSASWEGSEDSHEEHTACVDGKYVPALRLEDRVVRKA